MNYLNQPSPCGQDDEGDNIFIGTRQEWQDFEPMTSLGNMPEELINNDENYG